MNITEILKEILTGFTEIDSVNIDYTVNTNSNFGLYSSGENLIREFITGKKEYENNFVLYMFKESETDEQRIQNISLLNSVSAQLRNIRNYALIDNNEAVGYIESISCGNGMLFAVPGSIYEGYSYQLQIKVNYIITAPELILTISEPEPPTPPEPPEPPEPEHPLTVATYENGVFTVDGLCTFHYVRATGRLIRTDELSSVNNTSIPPEGAYQVHCWVENATEEINFCGYWVTPVPNETTSIVYGL